MISNLKMARRMLVSAWGVGPSNNIAKSYSPMLQEHKLQGINVAELEPKVLQIFNRACHGEHSASAVKSHVTVCAMMA